MNDTTIVQYSIDVKHGPEFCAVDVLNSMFYRSRRMRGSRFILPLVQLYAKKATPPYLMLRRLFGCIAMLIVSLSASSLRATAQASAAATPIVIDPYSNAVAQWNRWYPVGWSFTASQSLSVTALGLWLPDVVTETRNFTSVGLASYAVGLSRVLLPSVTEPEGNFSPYPSARTIVNGANSFRGQDLAGGAFWYTTIAPFDVSADESFSVWIDLADAGVYPYGFFQTLNVISHGLDPRLSYMGSWLADGAWLNGDPLYVFDGPGIGEGPNPINATIGGNFLIAPAPTEVSEPSMLWMVLAGALGMARVARRQAQSRRAWEA